MGNSHHNNVRGTLAAIGMTSYHIMLNYSLMYKYIANQQHLEVLVLIILFLIGSAFGDTFGRFVSSAGLLTWLEVDMIYPLCGGPVLSNTGVSKVIFEWKRVERNVYQDCTNSTDLLIN